MVCQEQNKKTTTALFIFAGVAVPVSLYVIGSEGPGAAGSALLGGVAAGGLLSVGYLLYECDFNLVECFGSGVLSGTCGAIGSVESALGL